jgi:valyl-tRNA synthetase
MNLSKRYQPETVEKKIYKLWEKSGLLKAKTDKKKEPFCIIMPPVNANGSLHVGHAVFITLQDIMIRFQRMQGKEVLWLPGVDHAGFETQVVFEKHLKKQGKTRFQYSSQELYKMIWDFCQKNRQLVRHQFKTLGSSCDWSREKFTLDEDIIEIVYQTFKKLYDDGLVYRGKRIINWCPNHGTALSDLEVRHKEVKGKLYYIKYPLVKDKNNYIIVATTRPETMLGDTAVAVNPKDKRYKEIIGQEVTLPLTKRTIKIIKDKRVDVEFGSGAVKVTPAHDSLDFEIGQDHKLETIDVINKKGEMTPAAGEKYAGLKKEDCREKVLEDLNQLNLLEKAEDYPHSIGVCYKCETPIESLVSEQWFLKIESLAQQAIEAVDKKKIEFIPAYFKKTYLHWMKNIKDWNISRQIIWGIRMPIWYCQECGKIIVTQGEKPKSCPRCKSKNLVQEKDTFDTWFSSGQWPFASLLSQKGKKKIKKGIFKEISSDFQYFYPTALMETGRDILFFWVARMIMLGLYATGEVPFHKVYLHGLVLDKDKQKMSKSKGNVIDPLGVAEIYGSDALRMALVFGTSAGRDIVISEDKIMAQKKFANKIWNATRFILLNEPKIVKNKNNFLSEIKITTPADKKILKSLQITIKKVNKNLEDFKFHEAAQTIYHFFWHQFCDIYIEESKKQMGTVQEKENTQRILLYTLLASLKLIHPFMPFVTEEIYQHLPLKNKKECLMAEEWPQLNKKTN